MKAREWYRRGQQAKAPIDALSDFWRAFNNLFAPVPGAAERDKIKKFLADKVVHEQAQKILDSHCTEIDYLLSQPVVDMRGNGRDTSANIQKFRNVPDPVAKLNELFMVIYQIRCNLEHGQKSPSRDRDVALCRCAAPIVADVVALCA